MSITRSALAGLATGGRSFSGISALTATTPAGATRQPDATLATPRARTVLGLLAAGEGLADKLPFAPSRLDFPGLQGRVLLGAACGVVVARRSSNTPPAQVAACALVGAAAALAGSYAGARFRGWASSRTRHDWIGALLEDAAVATLAAAAVKAPNPAG